MNSFCILTRHDRLLNIISINGFVSHLANECMLLKYIHFVNFMKNCIGAFS